MEVLRFPPPQTPLLRSKFTGTEAVKSSPAAVVRRISRRMKPLIYAAGSKRLNASSSPAAADDDLPVYPYDSLQPASGELVPNPDKGKDVTLDPVEYLRDILLSNVYDVANVSPFQNAPLLTERLGVNVWLKRDDQQPVFSFKLRGAYNMMSKLPRDQLNKGVITASAGNHAQGVALAAQRLGCDARIYMPESTPEIKQDAVRRLGGNVILYGDSFDESQEEALRVAEEEGLVFIPPFDNQDILKGQGTVGMEIVQQRQEPIEAIFVPIGGGGLVSGIAAYVRAILPDVKIIGVEPFGANGMALSFFHGQRVAVESVNTIADGVAVRVVGEQTYDVSRQLVDGVVLVQDCEIAAAIKDVYEETRDILEPSGAVALAGAKAYCKHYKISGGNVIAVCSGANMDFNTLRTIVDLADLGNSQEAILATYLPEEPGSLKRLCELVVPLNITELKYRYSSDNEQALIQYSVAYSEQAELDALLQRPESAGLPTTNYSESNLVQKHLRYLVGGRSNVDNELLCNILVPETAGSLLKFLNALNPNWNISLVHYRAQGAIVGDVLIGIQVADSEINEFLNRVDSVGYYYKVHPRHESLRLLR